MPTRDPEKNREYVAKHRAMMKAKEETKLEYNKLNKSYIEKFNEKLKTKLGKEKYNDEKAEYMRQYRAKQKQAKQKIQDSKVNILQNAIRNKLARNALLREKQNKANDVMSQINQNRKDDLIRKLNASVNANDMINDIFSNVLLSIPEKSKRGRPPKNS